MNPSGGLFKGSKEAINKVEIEKPLADAESATCEYYFTAYSRAADVARAEGNVDAAEIYSFLSAISSFYPRPDSPSEPFGPMAQFNGRRSLIPSDLSLSDIEALRIIANAVKNHSLRARCFDVLWVLTKDYKCCATAAENYIAAAKALDTERNWVYAVASFERGLPLASTLGRKKNLFQGALRDLELAARRAAMSTELFRCCQFLELLARFGCSDPAAFAQIAHDIGNRLSIQKNHDAARHYFEVEAALFKLVKNEPAERDARRRVAETFVAQAEHRVTSGDRSALAAAWFLQQGIEGLRQTGAPPEQVIELRKRLTYFQQESIKEMKTFSTEVDISEAVQGAVDYVTHPSLMEAIFRLSAGHHLTDLNALRSQVKKSVRDHPFTHIFSSTLKDEKGRTTANRDGLGPQQELSAEAFNAEIFSHAAQFHWPLRACGYIDPARSKIYNDHHPTLRDLAFLVEHNPFVPRGHEGIFLRGVHSVFHGDFLVASHLLVPQIEKSIRYVLESQGVDVSNLMSNGTQPVKMLGVLFSIPETTRIFGERLCFELRGFLIEKTAYDFRNRVAHGFVSEVECNSAPGLNVWWLIVRILATPLIRAQDEKRSAGEKG